MIYSTVFMPYEVGDYSIFVKENLTPYFRVLVYSGLHWWESKELLSSESGTIIYFNENIKDIFEEGEIYRANCYNKRDWEIVKWKRF